MKSPTIVKKATRQEAGEGSSAGLRGTTLERGGGAELASLTVSIADAKKGLSELCARVEYARELVVITKHGRPVAAIVSVEDLARMADLEDRYAVELLDRAIATSLGTVKVRPREGGA